MIIAWLIATGIVSEDSEEDEEAPNEAESEEGGEDQEGEQQRTRQQQLYATCDADMRQLSTNTLLHIGGYGLLTSATRLRGLVRQATPQAYTFLASFSTGAALEPLAIAAHVLDDQGTSNPYTESWTLGLTYEFAKTFPVSSLIVDGWETLQSCTRVVAGG